MGQNVSAPHNSPSLHVVPVIYHSFRDGYNIASVCTDLEIRLPTEKYPDRLSRFKRSGGPHLLSAQGKRGVYMNDAPH